MFKFKKLKIVSLLISEAHYYSQGKYSIEGSLQGFE